MKTAALKIYTEQLACGVRDAINAETNEDRMCDLLDAKEYLRRAWHCLDGSPCEDNQTTRECAAAMKS